MNRSKTTKMYSKSLVVLLIAFLLEISSALLPTTSKITNPNLNQRQNDPKATTLKNTPLTNELRQSQTINPQQPAVFGNNKLNSVPIQPATTQKFPTNQQVPTNNNKNGKVKPLPTLTLSPNSNTGNTNQQANKLQVIKPEVKVQTPTESLKEENTNGQANNNSLKSEDSFSNDDSYDDEDDEYDDEEDESMEDYKLTESPVQKTPLKPMSINTDTSKVQINKSIPKVQTPTPPTESLKKENINRQASNNLIESEDSFSKDGSYDEDDLEYDDEEDEPTEGHESLKKGNEDHSSMVKNGVNHIQTKPKPLTDVNPLTPSSSVSGISKKGDATFNGLSETSLPNNLSDSKDYVREDDQDDSEDDYYGYVDDEKPLEDDTVIESSNLSIPTVIPPKFSTDPQVSENKEEWIDSDNQDDYFPNSEAEDQQSSTSQQNDNGEWFTGSTDANKETTNNNYEMSNYDVIPNEESVGASEFDPKQWTNADKRSNEQENTVHNHRNVDDSHSLDANELENKSSLLNGYEMAKNVVYILRDYANLAFNWVVKTIDNRIQNMNQLS